MLAAVKSLEGRRGGGIPLCDWKVTNRFPNARGDQEIGKAGSVLLRGDCCAAVGDISIDQRGGKSDGHDLTLNTASL